ncbi:hypothetical protein [Streptomyces sp. HUAS ZL42]|uniref:hypothetical protein n=1 Tax=Streptomyces sp. HUAS ZL42 TaxID=3231715 RepID=UPI00345E48CE
MTGHRDRTASVSCSSGCRMPPRSRDIAALRRFAEAHAAAHARAATVRPDAACGCRQQKCAAHEGTRIGCAGMVVLALRHDPAVGQVWTLTEVCSACAPLMTHTKVVGRATPRARPATDSRTDDVPPGEVPSSGPREAPAATLTRAVPGGFSAPLPAPQDPPPRRGGAARRPTPEGHGRR